jgi:hypothetical protein
MKKPILLPFLLLFLAVSVSCSHGKYYQAADFEEETTEHQLVAVLPAEMIFTGKQPQNLTPEDITRMEEQESRDFQYSLYNSILRHANTKKYITTIGFQDVSVTMKKLEDNKIDVRKSWAMDDKELAAMLGVDAVIKMRIRKQRYMSDGLSYGVDQARRIISGTSIGSKLPVPYSVSKTNDIDASCNLVSNNRTLWNNNYRRSTDWNVPANEIIEGITDNFGRNFPYKRKKK